MIRWVHTLQLLTTHSVLQDTSRPKPVVVLPCRPAQDAAAAEEGSGDDSEATASNPKDMYDSGVLSDDDYGPSASVQRGADALVRTMRQTAEPLHIMHSDGPVWQNEVKPCACSRQQV